ncbi:MAG: CpaD family pilus assembly protein [Sphingomonas sp.]|jgi:pilus assembly protein CpaD
MTKRLSILTFSAPALLLSACGGTVNRGLESVHQPVVSRTDYVFDVNAGSGGLAPGEAVRLAGWLGSLRLAYGDHVAVDDPSPDANGAARHEIAGMIAQYGMFLADQAPITTAAVTPGTVRVIVSRSTAKVPGCPDFSRTRQPEFNSNTSSNQGCAVNANLAAMVADPNDLVRGQPGAVSADPAVSTKAIKTLRTAPPTGAGGLKSPGTATGGQQ